MEITLYGEIIESPLWGEDGEPVTVRINSLGGDVFVAMGIYNRLRGRTDVTVMIEGLCASAATIVACAGRTLMARDALYMIHNPVSELHGDYSGDELRKRMDALLAVEDRLATIYATKTGLSMERLRAMMTSETWLTADEALTLGFVDEIVDGSVEVETSDEAVTVNHVRFESNSIKNAAGLRQKLEGKDMNDQTLIEKLKTLFKGTSEASARVAALEKELDEARKTIATLNEELTAARSAVRTNEQIYQMIRDNLFSGASEVIASASELRSDRSAKIASIVTAANRGR